MAMRSIEKAHCIECGRRDAKDNMDYLVVRKYPRGTKKIYVHKSCIKFIKDKES